MAATLQAIVSGGTVTLTNGSPYSLLGATGMGAAGIHRVTAQGPSQDGDTDLGYRLASRDIELTVGFQATTDALLDGYRDTLTDTFKPLLATPINLRYTRDDGEVRQVDCFTMDKVKIDQIKEHRPAHYHKATIHLRAAEPSWYKVAPGTVTVTGTVGIGGNWWLAGGVIGTAQVLMHGGTPTQGEVWSYAGSVPHSSTWTLAFRSAKETPGTAETYAFHVDNNDSLSEIDVSFLAGSASGAGYYAGGSSYFYPLGSAFMPAGTANYFVRHDPNGNMTSEDGLPIAGNDLYNTTQPGYFVGYTVPIGGTARRWRSDSTNTASSRWTPAIPLYALYSPGLTGPQIGALDAYMAGINGGTIGQVAAIAYEGDLPEYPVISLRGPITGPVVTNLATGDTLDFGAITIGAGTTYIIDTRHGVKTVLAGTVNKRGELTKESDIGTWHLVPGPEAANGVNLIAAYGSNIGTATQIKIVYYDRFSSY